MKIKKLEELEKLADKASKVNKSIRDTIGNPTGVGTAMNSQSELYSARDKANSLLDKLPERIQLTPAMAFALAADENVFFKGAKKIKDQIFFEKLN